MGKLRRSHGGSAVVWQFLEPWLGDDVRQHIRGADRSEQVSERSAGNDLSARFLLSIVEARLVAFRESMASHWAGRDGRKCRWSRRTRLYNPGSGLLFECHGWSGQRNWFRFDLQREPLLLQCFRNLASTSDRFASHRQLIIFASAEGSAGASEGLYVTFCVIASAWSLGESCCL